jgi:uncharacterized protein YhjY with autotransporter beta-barrel domain
VTLTASGNDLYNTGYDGTSLAGNNQPDTHYVITNYLTGQTYQANPLAPMWVANSGPSQWITIANNTTEGPSIIYNYQLALTNIPVGSVVHISGLVAADDNATISANGASSVFSNFSPTVVGGNYASLQAFSGVTFVAGTTNDLLIIVNNNGGFATGLNLQLTGYYTTLTSTAGLGIALTPSGLTQNQTAVVDSINNINAAGTSNACFANLTLSLLTADPHVIGADLDQLSPEKLGVLSTIAFNNASFRTQDLDDYLAHRRNAEGNLQVDPDFIDSTGLHVSDASIDPQLSSIHSRLLAWSPAPEAAGRLSDSGNALGLATPAPATRDFAQSWNVFLRGDVVLGQDFSQAELDHTDYTTSSFEAGTDYQIGDHWLVGTLFDYSHTDTALDNQGSSATIDSYSPGLFASYADGGWFANALASYSFNNYTTARHIAFGSFNETSNGSPTGNEVLGDLDGGYEFHHKQWTYGPIAGLQYDHYNMDSFAESGGCSADLAVNNQQADSLRSRLGGRVSYQALDFNKQVIFTPYVEASWQHEWLDGSRCIGSSFREFNAGTFTVSTPATSRDSALLATGLDVDLTRSLTVFGDYAVQVGQNNYFGQSIEAGLKISF